MSGVLARFHIVQREAVLAHPQARHGVAIYQDPALTSNIDVSWRPGPTLTADGLICLANSSVPMGGNGNSNNSECTNLNVT